MIPELERRRKKARRDPSKRRSLDVFDDGVELFALSPEQRAIAEKSKAALVAAKVLPAPIVTPIRDAATFYPAEGYHQDYYKKNPGRYGFYRFSCGRDRRVESLWGEQAHQGIEKQK